MKKNKKQVLGLGWILLLVLTSSVISGLTAGVIVYNNNKLAKTVTYNDLAKDIELNQFLEVYANITSEYYENIDKSEMLQKAIAAMMNYLGDDYSTYLDDSDTNSLVSKLAGEYKGIGISINNSDKSITEVFEDTPASKAGIMAGDVIIGLNDMDVTAISADKIVALIKKETGNFTLKLKRNEEVVTVTLKSDLIIAPNIDYKIIDNTNIGYIYIDAFSNTLDKQMDKALKKLEDGGMKSLIIDLRNNTGGYLDAATKVVSMFTEKGKKIYSLSYKNQVTHYYDETTANKKYEIVVLTNGATASASEIMAAALKDSYGAEIVGEMTFGKGKVQQTMKLESGSMVKYTSAYWLTPNGVCIDEIGLAPDYHVKNEEIKDEEGKIIEIIDKQMEKAVELLTKES